MSAARRAPALLAAVVRRAQSTAVSPAAAAPAAPTALAPASLSALAAIAEARQRSGLTVTQDWNRYSLPDPEPFSLAEARKVPVVSAVTEFSEGRTVIIYRPARHALTSGLAATRGFAMRPGKRADAWGNPLMGWVSSTDTTQALSMHMAFESAEEAIAYAERNGWRYELQRDYTRTPGRVDAAYAYNFVPIAVQAKLDKLGARKARHQFEHATAKRSAFVNYRTTSWEHAPWVPAAAEGMSSEAWTGSRWPAAKRAAPAHGHGSGGH